MMSLWDALRMNMMILISGTCSHLPYDYSFKTSTVFYNGLTRFTVKHEVNKNLMKIILYLRKAKSKSIAANGLTPVSNGTAETSGQRPLCQT